MFVGKTRVNYWAENLLFNAFYASFVDEQRLSLLEEALCKVDSSDPTVISKIIDSYSQKPHLKPKSAFLRYSVCIIIS